MPYANREDKSARQRQRRREQREAQVSVSPRIATPRLAPLSPAPSPSYADRSAQGRRRLLDDYRRERTAGRDDNAAQVTALQRRAELQRQAEQQRQERQLQVRALLLMGEARRRLSLDGYYREDDVWPAAIALAHAEMRARQQPRQADPTPKRLAAPMPFRLAPEQAAGPVWMGRLRRATLSLGDGRAAAREESQATVQALLATLIRQPASAPLGVLRGLGTPPTNETSE
jgi:hypothetical protein